MDRLLTIVFLIASAIASFADEAPTYSATNYLERDVAGPDATDPWLDPYLPTTVEPIHYDLYQYPDFYHDGSVFTGEVSIQLDVLNVTDTLIVHIKDMNVTSSRVFDRNGNQLTLRDTFAYEPNQYWVVQTLNPLQEGSTVTLQLTFTGSLTNGIVGYYKSTYVHDVTGVTSWLATTKFQPSDARKAFPNFDEPRFKSEFKITLKHWQNFTALTNLPPESYVDLDDVWRETTFVTSPRMSSYLVCFIVSDFAYKNNTLVDGKLHRVWSRPDRLDQVDYALSVGPIVENFYIQEFAVPYPLPKLDQFAVPDYPSGATEHWGLITYRDTRLLYDPTQVGDAGKQGTLSIIAHELAHNHVGDLVTCKYWDDLWLNEGLASFYEVKGVTAADPTMLYNGQFFSRTVQSVLVSDGANSSRPIVIKITNPNEANAVFDSITYDKGAAVLNMMQGFLGEETFRRSITRFLQDNAYGSVVTDDLWKAFQTEIGSGLDIKQVMTTWVYSMGYPVIGIEILPGNQIQATQKRFLLDPTSDPGSPPSEYGYVWHVPLNYRTQGGEYGLVWLNQTASVVFDNPQSGDEWIKFNHDHSGYFRVNYDAGLWTLLTDQLNTGYASLTELERSNLISDGLNLAKAEQLTYDVALGLTEYAWIDRSLIVWDSIVSGFNYIYYMIVTTPDHQLFQNYVRSLTSDLIDRLQVADGGSHVDKLLRSHILRLSCYGGHSGCNQNITNLFQPWIIDPVGNAVPLNLRREVYYIGIAGSSLESDWNAVWDRYTTATSGQEKDNLLYALSRTRDLTLIDRLLQYSMDESMIRSQDFFTTIDYIAGNHDANEYLWDWVQLNYEALVARFGLDNRSLGRMVPGIVSYFNTDEQLQEVLAFFALYPDAGTGVRFREEALQEINANIRWMQNSLGDVVSWLGEHQP
jgi:glutamyl aminopeptidase